jgi:hypothetical protein
MEWLGNEVDKDYPVKECYPPLNMEDLWDL